MKLYEVNLGGGIKTTMQLDAQDAARYGKRANEVKAAPAPANKGGKPAADKGGKPAADNSAAKG